MPTIAVDAPVIETARLRLRAMTLADAPAVAASCAPWEVVRFTSSIPHPYPEDGAEAFIESTWRDWASGAKLIFGVAARDGDHCIGQVGLTLAQGIPGAAELSYLLDRSVWGRGYAKEMVHACLDFGFETRGFERIFARIFVENEASNALARAMGMVWRENSSIHAPARGRDVAIHWYDLAAKAWRAAS